MFSPNLNNNNYFHNFYGLPRNETPYSGYCHEYFNNSSSNKLNPFYQNYQYFGQIQGYSSFENASISEQNRPENFVNSVGEEWNRPFSGGPSDDPKSFFNYLKEISQGLSISENDLFESIPTLLSDDALFWFLDEKHKWNNFNEFSSAFLKQYGKNNSVFVQPQTFDWKVSSLPQNSTNFDNQINNKLNFFFVWKFRRC